MRRQSKKLALSNTQYGSTILVILIISSFMAVSMVWTMNYVLNERKMQHARVMRSGFEEFLRSLRNDLQDGYLCSRLLAGQPFPSWNTFLTSSQPEVPIQIRNYRWRKPDGTFYDFPAPNYLRGDDPTTPLVDEGTDIPEIGIHIEKLSIRRGLIYPLGGTPPLPSLRSQQPPPAGPLNAAQLWGQDRWYRTVSWVDAPPIGPQAPDSPPNYGPLTNAINTAAGIGGTPMAIIDKTSGFSGTKTSNYGMIFAAEIIIEPQQITTTPTGQKIVNTLIYDARDPNQPNKRIQLYVKATLATRANGKTEPVIIGCYGPNTTAQLCDQAGGNFSTLPLENPDNLSATPTDWIINQGRYYCQPDAYCWTRLINNQPVFGNTLKNTCQQRSGANAAFSPFIAQSLGNFNSGPEYTCAWCNANPVDPTPTSSTQYQNFKPVLPPATDPRVNMQRPNLFGGDFTTNWPYF